MTGNHHVSLDVACPACGVAGAIVVTEEAGPPFTDVPRRTYGDGGGKFVVKAGRPLTIECVACGASFPGSF